MVEISGVKQANDALAEMVALFRAELRSYYNYVHPNNHRMIALSKHEFDY